MSEGLALFALALCLGASFARRPWAPDWGVAVVAASVLLATGVLRSSAAGDALKALGPTVGFLACLLVLAHGCSRAGLFQAIGELIAGAARGRSHRLLVLVVGAASVTTVVLSLDATIVLLTPIVLATANQLRSDPRPHLYACAHLSNSSSLLLPISNLTNLIAFQDSRLSFSRFAALMALPWFLAVAIEWVGLRREFRVELDVDAIMDHALGGVAGPHVDGSDLAASGFPFFAMGVVVVTLAGFAASSGFGVAPVWVAAVAALVMSVYVRATPVEVLGAAGPTFLIFVLGLGVVVRAAGDHGLSDAITALLPHGASLPALLAIAGIGAATSNLVNNLPATLIILPALSGSGSGAVLAMLVGVNVGPNLTYFGSLATLLWRRILHGHGQETDIRRFTRLGLRTVPPILVASTTALWLGLQFI